MLAGQIAEVVRDVPALLTAPLYRRRHLAWGATAQEQLVDMPGDELFPLAQYRSTRAITIQARPEAVWPWLVQVGCGRAGFALLGCVLMEFGDFAMLRAMLRGIKQRAEAVEAPPGRLEVRT